MGYLLLLCFVLIQLLLILLRDVDQILKRQNRPTHGELFRRQFLVLRQGHLRFVFSLLLLRNELLAFGFRVVAFSKKLHEIGPKRMVLVHVRALQLTLGQKLIAKKLDVVRSYTLHLEPTLVRVKGQFLAHLRQELGLFGQDELERDVLVGKKLFLVVGQLF